MRVGAKTRAKAGGEGEVRGEGEARGEGEVGSEAGSTARLHWLPHQRFAVEVRRL